MKIERISENQIRCTLNKEDLAEKEILLTELAYGTEKAKSLFREMMQQASVELGFEVDEMPLMIEAIPVQPDSLILIITKVENPDELDTRFSRFTRSVSDSQEEDEYEDEETEEETESSAHISQNKIPPEAEGLIEAIGNLAEEITNSLPKGLNQKMRSNMAGKQTKTAQHMVFSFRSLNDVMTASRLVKGIYYSDNTLYKNPEDNKYYLYMTREPDSETEFIKACNLISEYALPYRTTYATTAYFDEHYKVIRKDNALQTLAEL